MSNVSHHLLSGALSGFASTIILQPFDLLKTRIQQPDYLNKHRHNLLSPQSTFIFRTARSIVESDGVLGLWRGTTASLLRNVPGVALYFTGLNQFRAFLATSQYFAPLHAPSSSYSSSTLPKLTAQGNLLAGALTRMSVGLVLNPFSVIKARYESSYYSYGSLSEAFLGLMRSGPSEIFRGAIASSLRDAPYAGIFVVFYEHIKATLSSAASSTSNSAVVGIPFSLSAGVNSLSAASAGAFATLATQPFDVLKTKMQVRSETKYRGVWSTVRAIWQQRGVAGFFDGSTLRMSRKIFSSAIGWAVYEGVLMTMRSSKDTD
ncbi:solute carrier family 25 member 38 [Dichomitus squalens]|uniref:Mitochondrial glycine transporter n=1 Tax=Dichomitus squalens TaxID=114155 RepID=A0A4V2K8T6_9APHY|nr:solute carrier family 25 member 38 [Dichomitus squalens LYAD-421 SS1]EJF63122.1 solute carrier family 25 member 38 [Dichomitus squalens LYAD-421 SS1]TBU27714.1 solute carrier family 25 member 38 [Dichomitus squalens]TBU50583.1 solute carrier family 25 member 38 [Dichomitus squalens]TBU61228.1 solute carrier family 25 member 38 [Dichomitus squalens]